MLIQERTGFGAQNRLRNIRKKMAVGKELIIEILKLLIIPGIFFLFTLALFYQWLDRRFLARLQNRRGPMHTGSRGTLQPLADFIKLLAKEDIEPKAVDKPIFRGVPILLSTISITALFLIPIWGVKAFVNFEGDLIFMTFLMTLIAILAFLGGWSSTNRFSTIGGLRAAMQTLGYEVPLSLAFIGPAIVAKSLSISKIVEWQASTGIWAIILNPLGFGIAIIALLAELEKIPFDIPEAETELVAGWQTEFSGRKLALLRFAFDLELVLAAGLITSLFLGGPAGPFYNIPWVGVIWFFIKTTIVVLILSNLRGLFARFRIDQMVSGCWKYLVPLAIIQIIFLQLVLG
jgi:NADH-quinone oxidoreductase subunit H